MIFRSADGYDPAIIAHPVTLIIVQHPLRCIAKSCVYNDTFADPLNSKFMKYTLSLLFILFCLNSFSQQTDPSKAPYKTPRKVTFITKVDIANATKDGMYMNGYVVNIDYEQAQKLNGKTIRVTGKVTIVKGLDPNDEVLKQGRSGDTKHILSPRIKILD